MKTAFSVIMVLASALLISACGGGKLTKEEAKRQIDIALMENKNAATVRIDEAIAANDYYYKAFLTLRDQGYITLTPELSSSNILVGYGDKMKPFLEHIQKQGGSYGTNFYAVANYDASVTSIAEPAPDATGSIVCNVSYDKGHLKLNELGQLMGYKEEENSATPKQNITAKFIKTQDGWKLKED